MSWPNARHYVPHLHRDQPRAQHCTLSGNSLAADPTVGQTQPNLLVEERRAEADGLRQRGDVVVLLEPRDRAEELEALVPHLRDIGLQHGTACCNTVRHVATPACCNTVQHVATRYSMLQHGTACCNTVQHVATMTPRRTARERRFTHARTHARTRTHTLPRYFCWDSFIVSRMSRCSSDVFAVAPGLSTLVCSRAGLSGASALAPPGLPTTLASENGRDLPGDLPATAPVPTCPEQTSIAAGLRRERRRRKTRDLDEIACLILGVGFAGVGGRLLLVDKLAHLLHG